MAHEAFALSPISARATQPSDEDYDAISEAFMETTRGRWFLGEYAKRNRNTDTRMVLDAVARIEQGLAAQKQAAPETGLAEALAGIRMALDEARAATSAAFDGLALEQNLAPVHKGIRVIREISWRWREIGADGRICDLIDQQINAIEASCGHIASADPRPAIDAAFALLRDRIGAYDDSTDTGSAVASDTQDRPAEAGAVEAAAIQEPGVTEAKVEIVETVAEAATSVTVQAADTEAGFTPEVTAEVTDIVADADAHDEAVLDMIAAEMGAPEPSDGEFDIGSDYIGSDYIGSGDVDDIDTHSTFSEGTDLTDSPSASQAVAMPLAAPAAQPAQPAMPPPPEAHPAISPEPSLGSALIANGIIKRPATTAMDPLAPIRRMSQAEKIALFS